MKKRLCTLQAYGGDILELQDTILKSFAEAVNKESGMSPDSRTLYGTVVEISDDVVYVQLDGADSGTKTPTKSLVQVGIGDVVMLSMKDHSVSIIGNISYPAVTRAGDIFITTTTEGLIIGKLNAGNVPTGNHILISNNDVQLRNVNGVKLASFGSVAQIGLANANHAVVDSNGLSVYNNNTLLARFGSTVQIGASNAPHTVINANGMIVYDASGNELFRAGNASNEFTGLTGSQSTGGMFAREGNIMAYKANGTTFITAGRGGIIAEMGGGRAHAEQNISLVADANWVGLYEDAGGWLYWYVPKDKRSYMRTLYGNVATDTLLRGPVTALWSGTLNPASGSTAYATRSVSGLSNWEVVIVRARCGNVFTHLVFAREHGGLACRVVDGSNATEVVVDFQNNYIAVRRAAGTDNPSLYSITSVTGLIRYNSF